jgi:hypothetical protein
MLLALSAKAGSGGRSPGGHTRWKGGTRDAVAAQAK